MEEDNGALVQSLIDLVNEIAWISDFRLTVKKQYCNLSRRLKLLIPMFEEIRDSKEPVPEDTLKALVLLKEALESAKKLLRFGSEGSKIFLAVEREQIMNKFHEVTARLEQALEGISYDKLDISDEVKEQEFESLSGLNINVQKSEAYSINLSQPESSFLLNPFGLKVCEWPATYLGFPLNDNPKNIGFWTPVIEKIEKRLHNWGSSNISKGGRLTLINATLMNLPIYYLSIFKAPKKVTSLIERCYRNYLWRGNNGTSISHLLKWNLVKYLKEYGGLGIPDIALKNEAMLAKWHWRFYWEKNALWRMVITHKYGLSTRDSLQNFRSNPSKGPWKGINNNSIYILENITYKLGNGKIALFWEDRWLESDRLMDKFPSIYRISLKKKCTIHSMWNSTAATWDFALRRQMIEIEIEEWARLINSLESVNFDEEDDSWLWSLEEDGKFTTKSLLHLLTIDNMTTSDQSMVPFYTKLWKGDYPKKVKFFMWELSHNCINTSEVLQKKLPGMANQPSVCLLCYHGEDTQNHLFSNCKWAESFWEHMIGSFGWCFVRPRDISSILICVIEGHPFKNTKKTLWLNFIYAFFWKWWLERNARLFNSNQHTLSSLISTTTLMGLSWSHRLSPFCNYNLSFLLSNWYHLI